ncbi:ornithine cyclodeaminase family protein [Nonomuraea sp. SMC257]|uniref:Ornithine cyclodeaminase family protein n=1 Tax=Nonomuraea montanisoli TaxID=2741721 RepID=A0A7Y6I4M3_9ACTN|nr:ornithine cyclodeaminase family protein [Nonomuraea montanisoli]NUW31635.1 ornithine cyclodeaminase family protein [Nonomuraea montanisoli]
MDVLILSDADIRATLDAAEVVATQERAFLLAGEPGRVRAAHTHHATFAPDGMAFAHAAVAAGETGALPEGATGVASETGAVPEDGTDVASETGAVPEGGTGVVFKTGTQHPANARRGLPTVHATVTVHDPETGAAVAVLNGTTITTLRTAGGLVAAARALSPGRPHTVGVLGAGAQATEFVCLMAAVTPVERFLMWSPGLAARGRARLDARLADLPVEVAASSRDLCERSGTVATCTLSRTPVVEGAWLRAGTTVLTMGSYAPDRREIDLACSARAARTYADLPEQALRSNGPVVAAVEAGVLDARAVRPLAAVLRGDHPARAGDGETVVFHSNGLGVQDAALAWRAYTRARANGLGTRVRL